MGLTTSTIKDLQQSIVPVSIIPSLVLCIVSFVAVFILAIKYVRTIKDKEARWNYNSQGCRLGLDGQPVEEYNRSRGGVVDINKCVTKSSNTKLYGISFGVALVVGFIIGSTLYRIMFAIKNPKMATGLFALNTLF